MILQLPYHFIVGERPILVVPVEGGGFDILGYEWTSGGFIRDLHSWRTLFDGGIDARRVDEEECRRQVESMRQARAASPKAQFSHVLDRLVDNSDSRDEKGMLLKEALEEKAAVEYNGDASRVTNIVCSGVVYKTLDELKRAPMLIEAALKAQDTQVVRIVDRCAQPLIDGYRDILLSLRYPNGHVGEMQLRLQPILDARNKGSPLYEEQGEINRRRLVEDRPFTSPETRKILELLQEQNQLYQQALARSVKF